MEPPDLGNAGSWPQVPPVRGSVDIHASLGGNGPGPACSGTTLMNEPTDENPDICRIMIATAHHCVANLALSSHPNRAFVIDHAGTSFKVPPHKYQIESLTGNHSAFAEQMNSTRGSVAKGGDFAAVIIETECSKLSFLVPVEIAESDSPPSVANFQKRNEPIEIPEEGFRNPGGGRLIVAQRKAEDDDGSLVHFAVPTPQGATVNGGDSGGGVYDENNRWIGATVSSSDDQGEGKPFVAGYDARGIGFVRGLLGRLRNGVRLALGKDPLPHSRGRHQDAHGPMAVQPAPQAFSQSSEQPIIQPTQSGSQFVSAPLPDNSMATGGGGFMTPGAPLESFSGGNSGFGQHAHTGAGHEEFSSQNTSPFGMCPRCGVALFHCKRCGKIAHPGTGHLDPPQSGKNFSNFSSPFSGGGNNFAQGSGAASHFGSGNLGLTGGNSFTAMPGAGSSATPFTPVSFGTQMGANAGGAQSNAPAGNTVVSQAPVADPTGAINRYENNMRYEATGNSRYRFDKTEPGVFSHIPQNGDGKIHFGYFGAPRPDVEALAANNPLVKVERFDHNSPEGQAAKAFGVQGLAVDGLGRKMGRYADDPAVALRSILNGNEPALLSSYLQAKQAGHANASSAGATAPASSADRFRPQLASLGSTSTPTSGASPGREPAGAAPPAVGAPAAASAHSGQSAAALPSHDETPLSHNFNPAELGNIVGQRCNTCHGKSAPAMPGFVANWNQWDALLQQKDPAAMNWLQAFNSKVAHGEMLTWSGMSKNHGEGKALADFIKVKHAEVFGNSRTASAKVGAEGAIAFIDPSRSGEYVAALRGAKIGDSALRGDLLEFDQMWDEAGNPGWSYASHGGDSGRKGLRPVSMKPAEPVEAELFKQVNGKWTWKEPYDKGFATDSSTQGIKKFVVVRFPRDAQGNIIRGVKGTEKRDYYVNFGVREGFSHREEENGDTRHIWASYPVGTKIFEVFYTTSNGKVQPIDVLVGEKRLNTSGNQALWAKDSLRADSSPQKIIDWAKSKPNWQQNPDLQKLIAAVNAPQQDGIRSDLGRDGSGGKPFRINGQATGYIPGTKSVLAGVNPAVIQQMYDELPMESALGSRGWALEVPNWVSGSHRGIPINSESCHNCHNSAGERFGDTFKMAGLPPNSTEAYGNVQGYDGVLSAPWNPAALGDYAQGRVRMDMDPGLAKYFEDFNPGRHPASLYRRVESLPVTSENTLRGRRY